MSDCPVILRKPEAERRTGYTARHLERLEAQGLFPRRIKLSPRAAGWLEHEVTEWIEVRIAASRNP